MTWNGKYFFDICMYTDAISIEWSAIVDNRNSVSFTKSNSVSFREWLLCIRIHISGPCPYSHNEKIDRRSFPSSIEVITRGFTCVDDPTIYIDETQTSTLTRTAIEKPSWLHSRKSNGDRNIDEIHILYIHMYVYRLCFDGNRYVSLFMKCNTMKGYICSRIHDLTVFFSFN